MTEIAKATESLIYEDHFKLVFLYQHEVRNMDYVFLYYSIYVVNCVQTLCLNFCRNSQTRQVVIILSERTFTLFL